MWTVPVVWSIPVWTVVVPVAITGVAKYWRCDVDRWGRNVHGWWGHIAVAVVNGHELRGALLPGLAVDPDVLAYCLGHLSGRDDLGAR